MASEQGTEVNRAHLGQGGWGVPAASLLIRPPGPREAGLPISLQQRGSESQAWTRAPP